MPRWGELQREPRPCLRLTLVKPVLLQLLVDHVLTMLYCFTTWIAQGITQIIPGSVAKRINSYMLRSAKALNDVLTAQLACRLVTML